MSFVSIARPRWNDTLLLDFLEEADQQFVLRVCRAFYNAPADENHVGVLPESLSFRWRLFFQITLRKDGLRIEDGRGFLGRGVIDEPWDNVREVRLYCFDHWSSELVNLEFEFDGQTIAIDGFVYQGTPSSAFDRRLRGAFHPVVEHFLRGHIPEQELATYALHGPPRSTAERAYRIKIAQAKLHKLRWLNRIVPTGMLIVSWAFMGPKMIAVWQAPLAMPLGWLVLFTIFGALSFSMHAVLAWAFFWSVIWRERKSIRELEGWQTPRENDAQKLTVRTALK